jgi:hypothetical protein
VNSFLERNKELAVRLTTNVKKILGLVGESTLRKCIENLQEVTEGYAEVSEGMEVA